MRSLALLVVMVFVSLACSPTSPSQAPSPAQEGLTYPVVASSDLALGVQRVLVALYDGDTQPVASPDLPVTLEFHSPGGGRPISTEAGFMWTIPELRGVYRAEVAFEETGEWAVVVHPEGLPVTDPAPFTVQPEAATPQVGDPAPRSETPTAAEGSLAEVSTDTAPDPRFYQLSIAEAVTSGRPTVVVFATPRFCTSQVCGPTLELIKEEAPKYPDANFVHVEVYDLEAAPEQLEPVPAVGEWGLPSEPWVFVVDRDGRVSARFEGALAPRELQEALEEAAA
ncbi:MAG: hypothetical protein M3N51_12400 [Actinomycetota bacterium]|nr:hypothetical protein [Actinomycetota bacterium]